MVQVFNRCFTLLTEYDENILFIKSSSNSEIKMIRITEKYCIRRDQCFI